MEASAASSKPVSPKDVDSNLGQVQSSSVDAPAHPSLSLPDSGLFVSFDDGCVTAVV